MRKKRITEIAGVGLMASVMTLLLCNTAFSEMRMGRLKIYPELSLSETYRSNIYQTETERKSDFVTTLRPGFRADYQFGARHLLSLGYNAGWLSYAKYSTNNYWDHRANGLLELNFPGGLEFALSHNFVKSTMEKTATTGRQRRYQENISNGSAAYKFTDRWKVEGKYNRDDLSFDSSRDRGESYLEEIFGGSMYYRFTPRTSALFEYDYVIKDFDAMDISDHKDSNLYLGVAFDPMGKLQGSFKAGYGWKRFDNRVAGRDNNPESWIVLANLTENFTSYTSLSFVATRALLDDTDSANASYAMTSAGATFQHFFTGKVGGFAMANYRQNDYLDDRPDPVTGNLKKRLDKQWNLGGGLIYRIQKWLETRIEYEYITKDSNFSTYSFNENKVMFKIVFTP